MKIFAAIVVALSSLAHAKQQIIQGTVVPPGHKTYMVSLRATPEGNVICGGFLITPTHVLSAGHCAQYNAKYIAIGSHFVNGTSDGERIAVKSQLRHPRFDEPGTANPPGEIETLAYDYMVMELVSPSKFQPVKLSSADAEAFAGKSLTVMGWGLTSENGIMSKELLRADLPVVAITPCLRGFNMTQSMASTLFCAGGKGKDSCNSDSGGPLVAEKSTGDVAVGIVTGGLGCGRIGIPGVNTKVSAAKDWILEHAPGALFE